MRAKDSDGLPGLDQKSFVGGERLQRLHDGVIAIPIADGLAAAAVDDQLGGLFGDVGIEIIHQHAHRGFLLPSFAGERSAARAADDGRACLVFSCQIIPR